MADDPTIIYPTEGETSVAVYLTENQWEVIREGFHEAIDTQGQSAPQTIQEFLVNCVNITLD